MQRILEAFFTVLIFLLLMELTDIALQQFVPEIAVQNILAVVAAFVSVIFSVWLSERLVRLVKKYL